MIIWCQWTSRKASCCVLKALPDYLCPIIPSKPLNRLKIWASLLLGAFVYKKDNLNKINEFIAQLPFLPYCLSNVDLMLDLWYQWLYEILQDFLPIITKHRSELAPCVNHGSSHLIKKMKTLQLKQQRKPTPTTKLKIEHVQTNLALALQHDQQEHELRLFQDGKFTDIQRYFKSVTKSISVPAEIFLNHQSTTTDVAKADLFNDYFLSVFTQMPYRVKTENKNVVIQLSRVYFTTDEVQSSLLQLVNKAKGPDRIGKALLKNLHKWLPKSLCLLFNLIACKARFPTKWKVAEIVPIYKDGDKQDASNYRPISLLSAVSKLLETLIFNKLIPVVYPTLNPAQHGFRPKRSTTTNLREYLHGIFSCPDSNPSYLKTFYIDVQKAFDKVSHDLLLDKLSALGIGGNSLSLLRSYLSNRKQTVRINSTPSKELDVFSGVPQGSILGPLFFLVFINDLPSCVMSKAFGYADDYKIIGTNPVTLNIDVRKLWRWCEDNMMSMNLTKSKLLCIKCSARLSLPNYTFEATQSIKYLGLFGTDSLNWTLHAKKRTEKALNAFFLLKRNLCKAKFATRKNAYVCYVVPNVGDLTLLESVQRKAMSWIFKTSNSVLSYKEKLQKINILPLSLYEELHVVLLFAKMLSGKVDIDWQSHVTLAEVGTRRAQVTRNFICKQMRLQKSESDFWYRACHLANLCNDYFTFDILLDREHKSKLLELYNRFFISRYNESGPCTWRLLCGCNNCRDLKKLIFT